MHRHASGWVCANGTIFTMNDSSLVSHSSRTQSLGRMRTPCRDYSVQIAASCTHQHLVPSMATKIPTWMLQMGLIIAAR